MQGYCALCGLLQWTHSAAAAVCDSRGRCAGWPVDTGPSPCSSSSQQQQRLCRLSRAQETPGSSGSRRRCRRSQQQTHVAVLNTLCAGTDYCDSRRTWLVDVRCERKMHHGIRVALHDSKGIGVLGGGQCASGFFGSKGSATCDWPCPFLSQVTGGVGWGWGLVTDGVPQTHVG